MTGDGFSKQMADTAKENRERLKRLRKEKEIPKLNYDSFDPDLLMKNISDDKLKSIRETALRNQRKTDLKNIIKITIIMGFILIIMSFYFIGIFVSKHWN